MTMISEQLEQMNADTFATQLKHEPITILLLSVTRTETTDQSRRLRDTRHQLLDLWDQIHLTDPTPAVICVDALLGCIKVNDDRVMVRPGSERVAGAASVCLLRILSGVGPGSGVVGGTRRRYTGVIPCRVDFEGPFRYSMIAFHALLIDSRERWPFEWMDYEPCAQEYASFANTLVQVAYNRRRYGKVPRWVLRFSLHSLSQDPPPPDSVVADCLSIIAIDLGCDVSSVKSVALDERCVDT